MYDRTDRTRLSELLACPRCDKAPLDGAAGKYRCGGCKTEFPCVGGIPWLFAEPDASLGEWRNRLHFDLQRLAQETQRLGSELQSEGLLPRTRERLELELRATGEHREALQQLLAPVDVQSLQGSYESHLALRTRLPRDQGLNTYYANIHRDWAWGEAENDAALDAVRKVLQDETLGNTLVLGAGACRFSYDLHTRMNTGQTVALDFNPLLLLLAHRVTRGESLELHEFPIAPRTASDVAVRRTLRAPEPVRKGFHLVLGDVLRTPFRPAAFNTVVTHWLVDIVPEEFSTLSTRINRLLKSGGRWLNSGSLAFDAPERAQRYGPEEIVELVGRAGFAPPLVDEQTVPYMCSPSSRHGRRETLFTFSAVKEANTSAPPRHRALPDWIVTGKAPVPLTPSFRTQALSTRIYSYIMSLIDGQRTIEDMALILEQQKLMPRAEAIPAIRNFLTRMYDDSQRQGPG